VGDDLSLFGTAGGYDQTRFTGPDDNMQHIDGQIGLMSTQLMKTWKIGGVVHYYRVLGFDYLTEGGGEAEASWRPNTSTTVAVQAEAVWQNYDLPVFGIGFYNGWRFAAQAGVAYRLDARSTIGGAVGYEAKNAHYTHFGYDTIFAQGHYHWLLGRGMYLDLLGELRWQMFRGADPVIYYPGTKERIDMDSHVRVAFGVPLSAFTPAGATGDMLEDFTLEASATYSSRNVQNVDLVDYDSTGVQLRLIWRFDSNG
jgi:hypothetical protein